VLRADQILTKPSSNSSHDSGSGSAPPVSADCPLSRPKPPALGMAYRALSAYPQSGKSSHVAERSAHHRHNTKGRTGPGLVNEHDEPVHPSPASPRLSRSHRLPHPVRLLVQPNRARHKSHLQPAKLPFLPSWFRSTLLAEPSFIDARLPPPPATSTSQTSHQDVWRETGRDSSERSRSGDRRNGFDTRQLLRRILGEARRGHFPINGDQRKLALTIVASHRTTITSLLCGSSLRSASRCSCAGTASGDSDADPTR
jgi:hypothetical protein